MYYYFEVTFAGPHYDHVLVWARNVIEAGTIALEDFWERKPMALNVEVLSVTRTEITRVVN